MRLSQTRRRFLKLIGATTVTTTVVGKSSTEVAAQVNESWPQYKYAAAKTGYASNNTAPKSDIQTDWNYNTGSETRLAVNGDTVFVSSNTFEGDNVYALSTADGSVRWSVDIRNLEKYQPAITNEMVFVCSRDGLYALSAADGSTNWIFSGGQSSNDVILHIPTPVVVDDTVFVQVRNNAVYALSADDGSVQWNTQINDTGSTSGGYPAVANGTVYVPSGEILYALDATDGTEQWTFSAPISGFSTPVVTGDTIYAPLINGYLNVLRANDGTEQYESRNIVGVRSVAVTENSVFIDKRGGQIQSLSINDLSEQWISEVDIGASSRTPLSVVDNLVIFGDTDNTAESQHLYAISADDGSEQWDFEVSSDINYEVTPVVANKTIFIGTEDGIQAITGESSSLETTSGSSSRDDTEQTSEIDQQEGEVAESQENNEGSPNGGTTIFRRFRGDSALPIGVVGGGILGGIGIAAYRRLQSDTDDTTSVSANTNSEETAIAESSSSKPVEKEGYIESTYTDYEQDVELRQTEYLNVTIASVDNYADVAFYTSAHINSETIDKALADELASGFETWSKVDDHENILTVYQHGDTPTLWAAVELADNTFDPADFADESVVTKRNLIVDLCNAVYEGHRYGLAHGGLGVSTFVVETDGTPTLRVGDWGVTDAVINDNADQSSDIDQVVDIAFELFTSESPAADINSITYPDGLESVFETAWDDGEGYETVIHFRDAILEAI